MSTEITNISQLPIVSLLMKNLQAMALLDAILMPDWDYRYYSFDSNWDVEEAEMMGSMRNSEGSEFYFLFTKSGVVGKILSDNELPDPQYYLAEVPSDFNSFKNEPAFSLDRASFFCWYTISDNTWHSSPQQIGSYPLLSIIEGGAMSYKAWADEYYELDLDLETVSKIFQNQMVSEKDLSVLNHQISMEEIKDDLDQILGHD